MLFSLEKVNLLNESKIIKKKYKLILLFYSYSLKKLLSMLKFSHSMSCLSFSDTARFVDL